MKYCTLDDITARRIPEESLVQLTDDAGTGSVDQVVVDAAIDAASELIDSYLRKRLTLPLSTVPPLLISLATAIAAYEIYGHRPEFETPERIVDDYKSARADLVRISRGEIQLETSDDSVSTPSDDLPAVSGPAQKFSDDALENY